MSGIGLVPGIGIDTISGPLSIWAQALAVLKSFGSGASEYPFAAVSGMYQTSAGPAAVSVNDPIGLELDALGTVGVNVITGNSATFNSGVGSWTSTSASIAAVGGELQITQTLINGRAALSFACNAGSTYEVSADVRSINGIGCSLGVSTFSDGNGAQFAPQTTSSTYTRQTLRLPSLNTPNTSYNITVGSNGGGTGVFACGNVSVKEVTGNHATQATTINRPTLQKDGGNRWYASFNGTTSSLALSSVPFQMADDFAVVACVNCSASAAIDPILNLGGTTAKIQLAISGVTGFATAVWIDDTLITDTLLGAVDLRSTVAVLSLRKVGNVKVLRVNGVQVATNSTVMGAATFTSQNVGTDGTLFFNGAQYDLAPIKGTVTDAQLLTLEKAAGLRAGLIL